MTGSPLRLHPPTWIISRVLKERESEVMYGREHTLQHPQHLHGQGKKNLWEGMADMKMRCENFRTISCANKFPYFNIKRQSHCEFLIHFYVATLCTSWTKVRPKASRLANSLMTNFLLAPQIKTVLKYFYRLLNCTRKLTGVELCQSLCAGCRTMFPYQNSFPPRWYSAFRRSGQGQFLSQAKEN